MPEGFTQVNTNLTTEDVGMVDQMMAAHGYENRSAFMRWLIREEWKRRHPVKTSSLVPAEELAEVEA